MDEAGNAPFWDALAGRFFGMSFPEADEFNAVHGTQFIADLMPKTPIYVALLADSAQGGDGPAAPERPGGAADARARGLRLRPLHRHFRRRADGDRADRPDPHDPRSAQRDGRRDRRRRARKMLLARRPAEGLPRLLRVGQEAAEEGHLHRRGGGRAARGRRSATSCRRRSRAEWRSPRSTSTGSSGRATIMPG